MTQKAKLRKNWKFSLENVVKKRLKKNWSQAELGRRCKIHPSLISKVEAGDLNPWKKLSRKLQRLFRIPLEDLGENIRGPPVDKEGAMPGENCKELHKNFTRRQAEKPDKEKEVILSL